VLDGRKTICQEKSRNRALHAKEMCLVSFVRQNFYLFFEFESCEALNGLDAVGWPEVLEPAFSEERLNVLNVSGIC
jgi:hypothetical protein